MNGASPGRDRWFYDACAVVAFAAPFGVALGRAAGSSAWRDDLPVLRGLAWVGNGLSGALSAILVQAAYFLPLGSLYFRAAWGAAIALGAASAAVFLLARRLLARSTPMPRLAAVLALLAALMTTVGVTGQREGSVAGGASVALLVAMLALQRPAASLAEPRRALPLGMLLGALLAENAPAACASVAAIAAALPWANERPRRAACWWCAGGAALTALFALAPSYVRPLAPAAFLDLGRAAALLSPQFADAVSGPVLGGIGLLRAEVGWMALGLAAGGGAVGLARRSMRGGVAPLAVIVGCDALSSLREGRWFSASSLLPLHCMALAALSVGVAVAVQAITSALLDLGLPMARGATIFIVMCHLTMVAASAEEATFVSDESAHRGARAFTDEALERLPPNPVLLARSPDLVLRAWAARLVEGARPDVLLVPARAASEPRLALSLLRGEPALQQALRDLALDGRPGEPALTILADERQTFVELDPAWDHRVISHLLADHFWLRFAAQPVGRSDRRAAFAELYGAFERVLLAGTDGERVDPSTADALRLRLTDAAAQAAVQGEREDLAALLEHLGKVSRGDRFVNELTRRLAADRAGAVDVKGLLR